MAKKNQIRKNPKKANSNNTGVSPLSRLASNAGLSVSEYINAFSEIPLISPDELDDTHQLKGDLTYKKDWNFATAKNPQDMQQALVFEMDLQARQNAYNNALSQAIERGESAPVPERGLFQTSEQSTHPLNLAVRAQAEKNTDKLFQAAYPTRVSNSPSSAHQSTPAPFQEQQSTVSTPQTPSSTGATPEPAQTPPQATSNSNPGAEPIHPESSIPGNQESRADKITRLRKEREAYEKEDPTRHFPGINKNGSWVHLDQEGNPTNRLTGVIPTREQRNRTPRNHAINLLSGKARERAAPPHKFTPLRTGKIKGLAGLLATGAEGLLTHLADYALPLIGGAISGVKGFATYDENKYKDGSSLYGLDRTQHAFNEGAKGFFNSLTGVGITKSVMAAGHGLITGNDLTKIGGQTVESAPKGIISAFKAGFSEKATLTGGGDAFKKMMSKKEVAPLFATVDDFQKLSEKTNLGILMSEGPALVLGTAGFVARGPVEALKEVNTLYQTKILDVKKPPLQGQPIVKNEKSVIPGVVGASTGTFMLGTGVIGTAVASSIGAPDGHPVNAFLNTRDVRFKSQAQMEADMAEKSKIQNPRSIGLSDVDETYFTNPALKNKRGRHYAGKYNDDGNLVFALSVLRRG